MADLGTCGECRFWQPCSNVSGMCRRHSPRRMALECINGSDSTRAIWPFTDAYDWCGEFERNVP